MTSRYDFGPTGNPVIPLGTIFNQATVPSPVKTGDIWFDQTAQQWKMWDGAVWVIVVGGGGAALPPATRQGQVLIAGAAPTFTWAAGDTDEGRF